MNAPRHLPTWKIVIGVLLAFAAIAIGYCVWLNFWFTRPYHEIAIGDSEARVISLLGKPYEVSSSNAHIDYKWETTEGFGVPGRKVVKEFTYRVPVISGDEFVIGFDAEGHAVFKNRLTSP
jgi:hypothetical protein